MKNSVYPVCRDTRLHMIIQRFCFLKFTKPVDERHLQAFSNASSNLFPYAMTVSLLFKTTAANTDNKVNKYRHAFCVTLSRLPGFVTGDKPGPLHYPLTNFLYHEK
jgi:hypothetical protein